MKKGIYISHPDKASMPSKTEVSLKTTESTKGIESDRQSETKPDDLNEFIIRTTVDIPKKWHKAVKRLLLEEELSFRAYLMKLIEKDFKSRGRGI